MEITELVLKVCLAVLAIHLIIISGFAVYQTKRDKKLSNVPKDSPDYWRVPEAQLMLIAAMGGSFAMFAAMRRIRHKTQHPKFMIGIPALMILQLALVLFLLWLRFC
ncbi:MAG: DUF1294 domain-containing protein [Clostridia bacterium]|nr:DUF1294 domain-containing protein [Clostridia bacterium]